MEKKLAESRDSRSDVIENSAEKRRKFDKVLAVEVSSTTIRNIPEGEGFINRVCMMLEKNGVLGEYKNADTGWGIAFNKQGARNALKHFEGDRGAALTEHVPDLIRQGVFLETTQKDAEGRLVSHVFAAKASFDGEECTVGFVVREDMNGRRYYVHDIMTDAEIKKGHRPGLEAKTLGPTDAPQRGDSRKSPQSIYNILKKHLGIKKKIKIFSTHPPGASQIPPDSRQEGR